jgi:sugar phosphate isomerase/epimerase
MGNRNQVVEQGTAGLSRRGFLGAAAAAAATATLASRPSYASQFARTPGYVQGSQPNSKFGNVQIGAITGVTFGSLPRTDQAEEILTYLVLSGLSSCELRGDAPILNFMGAPTTGAPTQQQIGQMTDPAQREAATRQRAAHEAEMKRWYASPPMERVAALKKMYNDAGVTIHLAKLSTNTPEATEFAFRVAKALGARGNTAEMSADAARMLGPVAVRHQMTAPLHNHEQTSDPNFTFDSILAISPGVSLNLDLGHYYASTGKSPVPEIKRLHQRITSVHLKDRSSPEDGGLHLPWGQGGTPLAEILRLLHRENWGINADIELSQPVPAGSNQIVETRKCVEFCREVLTMTTSAAAPARGGGGRGGAARPAPSDQ